MAYAFWNPQGTQSVAMSSVSNSFQMYQGVALPFGGLNGDNARYFDRDAQGQYSRPASNFNGKTWSITQWYGYTYVNQQGTNYTQVLINQGTGRGPFIYYSNPGGRLWVRNQGNWWGSGGQGGQGGNGGNNWNPGYAGGSGGNGIFTYGVYYTPIQELWVNTQGYWFGGGGGGGITLKTNGTDNTVQNILDLVEGSNITLTDNGDGSVTIDSSGGTGTTYTVNNGLSENPVNNFKLGSLTTAGSPLLNTTYINAGLYSLIITGTDSSSSINYLGNFSSSLVSVGTIFNNQNRITFDDSGNRTYISGPYNNGVYLDYANFKYRFGETNGNAEGTYLEVDSSNGYFNYYSNNAGSGGIDLQMRYDGYEGVLSLYSYGKTPANHFNASPVYSLGVDSTGNIVECTPPPLISTVVLQQNLALQASSWDYIYNIDPSFYLPLKAGKSYTFKAVIMYGFDQNGSASYYGGLFTADIRNTTFANSSWYYQAWDGTKTLFQEPALNQGNPFVSAGPVTSLYDTGNTAIIGGVLSGGDVDGLISIMAFKVTSNPVIAPATNVVIYRGSSITISETT